MNLVKVKFLKDGIPAGREYTYWSGIDLKPDDIVEIPHARAVPDGTPYMRGEVTKIDVHETEVEAFKDKVKTIIGLALAQEETESEELPYE